MPAGCYNSARFLSAHGFLNEVFPAAINPLIAWEPETRRDTAPRWQNSDISRFRPQWRRPIVRVRSALAVSADNSGTRRFSPLSLSLNRVIPRVSRYTGTTRVVRTRIRTPARQRERERVYGSCATKLISRARVNYSQQISDSFPRPARLRRSIGHADIPGRFIDEGVPCRIGEPGRAEPSVTDTFHRRTNQKHVPLCGYNWVTGHPRRNNFSFAGRTNECTVPSPRATRPGPRAATYPHLEPPPVPPHYIRRACPWADPGWT